MPLGNFDVRLNLGTGETLDLSDKSVTKVELPDTKKIDPLILTALRNQTTAENSERWMFLQHISALEDEIRILKERANSQRTVIADALGLVHTDIKTVDGCPVRKVVRCVNPAAPSKYLPNHVILECGHSAWTNEYDYPCEECKDKED